MPRFVLLLALFATPLGFTGCDSDVMEPQTPMGTEVEVDSEFGSEALQAESGEDVVPSGRLAPPGGP